MRAFYHDAIPGNQTALHDSGRAVSEEELNASGVLYFNVPVDDEGKWEKEIDSIAKEREYKNRDVKESSRAILGDSFNASMEMVYKE